MGKAFFDVFPTLKVNKELWDMFEETTVEKLATNRQHNRYKVSLRSDHLITKRLIFTMEDELVRQVFEAGGRKAEVYIEEHYSLSSLYDPKQLMQEYRTSLCEEMEKNSPVMAAFFRQADISYPDSQNVLIRIEDSFMTRKYCQPMEEAMNRIFRDRCGVPASVVVSLTGRDSSKRAQRHRRMHREDSGYSAHEPSSAAGAAAAVSPGEMPWAEDDMPKAEATLASLSSTEESLRGTREKTERHSSNRAGKQTERKKENSSDNRTGSGKEAAEVKPVQNERPFRGGRRGPGQVRRSNDPNVIYGTTVPEECISMEDIIGEIGEVVVHGQIMNSERRDIRNHKTIVRFAMTDFEDSICCKIFVPTEAADEMTEELSEGKWVRVRGITSFDSFDKQVIITSISGIMKIPAFGGNKRHDTCTEKRVELHCHTKMSDMDGVSECKDLVRRAYEWGMPAIAITDHGNIQAFPDANHMRQDLMAAENKRRSSEGLPPVDPQSFFKVIYGVECYLVDDLKKSVMFSDDIRPEDKISDHNYVVFDLETTGLSPVKNQIIEFGAVKIEHGKVTDRFSEFVNPQVPIPYSIQKLTGISDDMVAGAQTIDEVLPRFLEFSKETVLVGHNVGFDIGFVKEKAKNLGLECRFTTVDTEGIARILLPGHAKYTLDSVAKLLSVSLENHHRAVDDAECTSDIFQKEVPLLERQGAVTFADVNALGDRNPEIIKRLHMFHCVLLAKNEIGRVNLYKMISASNLTYFFKKPRIPKSLLMEHREGILVGSACVMGELFQAVLENRSQETIAGIMNFYDYLEIQPRDNNRFLLENERYQERYPDIRSEEDLLNLNRQIVALGEDFNKPVVATGDVHFLDPKDQIYRTIIQDGMGMSEESPAPLYLRTTDEMLEEFSYLGREKAREVVVDNTQLIADMIDAIQPVRPDKCPPVIENSDRDLKNMCYKRAHELYGDPLPDLVAKRLEKELHSIISNGYSVMYIIAQKLVSKSNSDGYLVGSRGSVGSSFVATMSGITEVNPLPPHYYCTNCHYTDFDSETVKQYQGRSGIDMPKKICPVCGQPLKQDGFDIPFETFLGFKGDKEPDIDLNFSGEYQGYAHRYTEVIFGKGHTFKAGTIATVAEKTAYGYVKNYFERKGVSKRNCEIDRLKEGCVGIRRSTGQHPGGIVVLPHGEDINTFTPVQHPANDMTTDVITTHFDYHSIDHNLLKLDILGHDDPTMIRMLQDLTGIDPLTMPLNDEKVLSLFSSPAALGITPDQIGGVQTGSLGVPELGTKFVIGMLEDTKPSTVSELVRISGLSHGTDVWLGNAQTLIQSGKATLSTAICCRDDIMSYLISMGVESSLAFKTMESVRKGKGLKPEMKEAMIAAGVPDWYIDSCLKIKYMFPRAHAAAYIMMALRIAYCKVYYPLAYYAAYFSIRASAFSYEIMCQGQAHLLSILADYEKRRDSLSQKELAQLDDMYIVREMYARGFDFVTIDIYKAGAKNFKIMDGKIMPALTSIDGMGLKAAEAVVEAVKDGPFISRDDLWDRTKVPKPVVEKMAELGLLGGLPQSNQISMFDLM